MPCYQGSYNLSIRVIAFNPLSITAGI